MHIMEQSAKVVAKKKHEDFLAYKPARNGSGPAFTQTSYFRLQLHDLFQNGNTFFQLFVRAVGHLLLKAITVSRRSILSCNSSFVMPSSLSARE
jgi:hypothetical protein